MASRWTDQGLQDALINHFGIAAVDICDAMGVSDLAGGVLAGTVSIAGATNKDVNAFDATPTRSAQTVTMVTTWVEAEANFPITTITGHNDGAGVYTGVQWGIDSVAFTKNNGFKLKLTVTTTWSTV